MVPMYAPRQRRLERGEIHDERQHATVLSKNNLHAWAQRSQCGQGWTVYFPATPNNFVGKFVKTLREALVVMAGWLNFTETEALQVIK